MEGRWPEDGVLGLALLLMGDSFGPDLDLEDGSIADRRTGVGSRSRAGSGRRRGSNPKRVEEEEEEVGAASLPH